MSDVFVSYARMDEQFVSALCDELRERGKDIWIDSKDIPPTADWRAQIESGIESADVFVFVVSPASLDSDICAYEIAHAAALRKRIVPVVSCDVHGRKAPDPVAARQWIFCREREEFQQGVATLVEALDRDLDWVQAHTRLLERAIEWADKSRDPSYLLRGSDLGEAERWLSRQGSDREPAATSLQQSFVFASRRAATRRQRFLVMGVGAAGLVSLILAVLAWTQRNEAVDASEVAFSRELAANSLSTARSDLELSLLLARDAIHHAPTAEARDALRLALAESEVSHVLRGHGKAVNAAAFSATGDRVVTAGDDGTARVWNAADASQVAVLRGHKRFVTSAAFAPGGRRVVTGSWTARCACGMPQPAAKSR